MARRRREQQRTRAVDPVATGPIPAAPDDLLAVAQRQSVLDVQVVGVDMEAGAVDFVAALDPIIIGLDLQG